MPEATETLNEPFESTQVGRAERVETAGCQVGVENAPKVEMLRANGEPLTASRDRVSDRLRAASVAAQPATGTSVDDAEKSKYYIGVTLAQGKRLAGKFASAVSNVVIARRGQRLRRYPEHRQIGKDREYVPTIAPVRPLDRELDRALWAARGRDLFGEEYL